MYQKPRVYGMTFLAVFAIGMMPVFAASASTQSIFHIGTPLKANANNKFVLAVKTDKKIKTYREVAPYLANHNLVGAKVEVILSTPIEGGFKTLVQVKHQTRNKALTNMRMMERSEEILWAYPTFAYVGDPREETREENREEDEPTLDDGDLLNLDDLLGVVPNDEKFKEQLHHKIIGSTQAWEIEQGSEDVIVAVTDDGVDFDHVDLKNSVWNNKNEIPDNDIDDDGNGYVDDVNGWDFSDDDNNPRPRSFSTHGTHVAGIIAAEMGNKKGVAGIAPKVKVMPIRFFGGAGDYDSAIFAKSYGYAVDNGAKIITTSYNINQFVGDPVYETTIKMAYDAGVLLFNSGGNNNFKQPKRVAFKELILVSSVETDKKDVDKKSRFSNYGVGLDIAAPGHLFSTVNDNKYAEKSGTSMASPAAAAVAALIWSQNPTYTRDQVAAILLSAVDNVDAKNKKYVGQLGSGRINAFKAVTIHNPKAPSLSLVKEQDDKEAVQVQVNGVFDATSINNLANWTLSKKTATGTTPVKITEISDYKIGSNVIEVKIGRNFAAGTYIITANQNLKGPFGNAIDGNNNGASGGTFKKEFIVKKEVKGEEIKKENEERI